MNNCKHARTIVSGNEALCGLVVDAVGMNRVYVPVLRCEKCSGEDDGNSHASLVINHILFRRVAEHWNQPQSDCGCSAGALSVADALARLAGRNKAMAEEAVVAAAKNGMPVATATALAKEHLKEG